MIDEEYKGKAVKLAEDTGLAVVFVDEKSSVVFAANDNSVCETLCASEEFGSECGRQCGQAFQMASQMGGPVNFECHAGLECTVVPVECGRPLVAIVGRSFTKSETYHKATERALSGDWQNMDPGELFSNALLSSSPANFDKAVRGVSRLFPKPVPVDAPQAPVTPVIVESLPEFSTTVVPHEPAVEPSEVTVGEAEVSESEVAPAESPLISEREPEESLEAMSISIQEAEPIVQTAVTPQEDSDPISETAHAAAAEPAIAAAVEPEPIPEPVSIASAAIIESPVIAAQPVREPAQTVLTSEPFVDRNPDRDEEESQRWRVLLSSMLGCTYREACARAIDFLHERYSIESIAWLERRDGHFETVMSDGRFAGRHFRIAMGPADERMKKALASELPLELNSSSASGERMAVALFPVAVGDEIKSALAVSGGADTEELKRRISRFCAAIAAQIEILRLREEVQRRGLLSNAVERFNRSLDKIESEQFWADLLNISAELMQAERGSLMVYDEKKKEFDVVAVIGASPSRLKSDRETVGKRVAEAVLRRGIPIVVSDAEKAGLSPSTDGRKYKTRSFISYPFRIGNDRLGVLNVTDKVDGTEYSTKDLELLNAVAPQFNVLIDRATLISKAGEYQQLSVTDPLTGLLNRRYLRERLAEEVQRTLRTGQQMSFMMIDVDDFKSYNDTFGHAEGDHALQVVARCLKDSLRGADVAVRFGGEEFSILLPQTSAEEARVIGERVRARIAGTRFRHRQVTVSIGIASCCKKIKTPEGLIEAADKALYLAKRDGRNLVRQFDEQEVTESEIVLKPVDKVTK